MNFFKPYIQILIVLTICIIGVFVLYFFTFIDIKKRNENISLLENNLSSESNEQELTASMEATLKNNSADITRINDSFVPVDGDVDFIEDLESLAKENNLEMEITTLGFQDDPSISSSTMTYFNIKAKTTGSWAGTYLFFAKLETLPVKIRVNRSSLINISTTGDTDIKKGSLGNTWQNTFEISVLKLK